MGFCYWFPTHTTVSSNISKLSYGCGLAWLATPLHRGGRVWGNQQLLESNPYYSRMLIIAGMVTINPVTLTPRNSALELN